MKKTIKTILGLACALVLFASCSPGAVNFDIKFGELQYGSGKDKVHVEITSDNSNVNVRGSECWWTFDGSEPTEASRYNNSDATSATYEFDMEIPSDFYSGKIKFLCKIKQAAMGKKTVVTKKISKNFETKYHSVGSRTSCDLYKGKGYQNEYFTSTIPVTGTDTFNVKEDGTLKITFLLGDMLFKVGAESIDSENYSRQVSAGDTITVHYHSDIVAASSSSSGTKSGEYLLILE